MTTGSVNNQSFDTAVSDIVVMTAIRVSGRLFFQYLRGFGICTCSKLGKENCRSPGIKPGSHFMVDLELFCGYAQFGQNVEFISFYSV